MRRLIILILNQEYKMNKIYDDDEIMYEVPLGHIATMPNTKGFAVGNKVQCTAPAPIDNVSKKPVHKLNDIMLINPGMLVYFINNQASYDHTS